MDTPRQFPSDDEFDKLADVRVRHFGENGQRRVIGGVELEPNVLAVEAHAWASVRVAEMVSRLARLAARNVRL